MKKRPTDLLGSPHALGAHQELAAAVIRQAVVDAANPQSSVRLRANARTFLAGSPMLRHWCIVAGLDLSCVERAYQEHRARLRSQAAASLAGRVAPPHRVLRMPRSAFGRMAANVRQQSSRMRILPDVGMVADRRS
jgi:hypothetical protein